MIGSEPSWPTAAGPALDTCLIPHLDNGRGPGLSSQIVVDFPTDDRADTRMDTTQWHLRQASGEAAAQGAGQHRQDLTASFDGKYACGFQSAMSLFACLLRSGSYTGPSEGTALANAPLVELFARKIRIKGA